MNFSDMRFAIASAVSGDVAVRDIRAGHAQLYMPFTFPDGDGLVVHLRDAGSGRIEISDNAHTFMHLSYGQDPEVLLRGARGERLEAIRRRHGVEERDGELVRETETRDIGRAAFGFTQALLEIVEMAASLERSRVESTFREDLRGVLRDAFAPHLVEHYVDEANDPEGEYPIPYVLNGVGRPIGIFDVLNDSAAAAAVIVAQRHREWGRPLYLVAVEKKQEELNRRHVAWLSNAIDKQFSTLQGNEQSIVDHLREQHRVSLVLDRADASPPQAF